MKSKKHLLKKLIAGIAASVMVCSVVPQLPAPNSPAFVEAAQVKLNKKKLTLRKGKTKKLVLKNADGKITWKSSKKSVASVSRTGVVTAKKSGKATITAKYNGEKYKCKVTVTSGSSSSSNSGSTSNSSSNGGSYSTVYWTPSGQVYHVSRSCPTLSRSRTVYSGTTSESGRSRACKVCS